LASTAFGTGRAARFFGVRIAPLSEIFGVDLRTLALFRIGLAALILVDLALRARDLRAHYTDFGVMPREAMADALHPAAWSLHAASGELWFQVALFCIAAGLALMLLAGWRTRLATAASWAMLVSVQNRNPQVLSGEDVLIVMLAFWAMFLPLGARFSVDAAGRDAAAAPPPNAYASVASAALLVQGMSMYLFSALLKSDAQWIPDGTAVYYALQLDYFATPFALWFRQFEGLMQALTYYVWTVELVGPFLIFCPVFHRPLRLLFLCVFVTMHTGFWLCLEIGLFPAVSILMNLTFLPGWVWDRLRMLPVWRGAAWSAAAARVTVLAQHLPAARVPLRPGLFVSALTAMALGLVTFQNVSTLPAAGVQRPAAFVAVREALGL
jgi:hypothetical protein